MKTQIMCQVYSGLLKLSFYTYSTYLYNIYTVNPCMASFESSQQKSGLETKSFNPCVM